MPYSDYNTGRLWGEAGVRLDPWGNEYQLVELNRDGIYGSRSPFHVYSFGADGISKSDGNDADDISSWGYGFKRYYKSMLVAKQVEKNIWRTLWITPVIYIGFLCVSRLLRTYTEQADG
ncbi:hypothetical protein Poly24_45850 [Rosistilla carotiformis]|uniref:Type II secretion system protein GspG C-terminal domain-containing protein n=2 Tax=Rosistilla carotiformis TaxID=2528017 RepID=A0A518JZ87_9BACT|nr:hypothetical protein Poly24_45850 [Rosistilla carotiformis]